MTRTKKMKDHTQNNKKLINEMYQKEKSNKGFGVVVILLVVALFSYYLFNGGF